MRNLRRANLGIYGLSFLTRTCNLPFSPYNFRSHTYNHLYPGVNTSLISRTALNLYPTRYLTTGEESREPSDEKLKETFTLSESTQEKPSLNRVDELLENLRGDVIGLKAQGIPALEDKFADLQDFVGATERKVLELRPEIEEMRENIQNLKFDDLKSKSDAYTKRINMISAGLWLEFLLLLGGFISLYFAYDQLKQQLPPENLLKEIKAEMLKAKDEAEVLRKECNNIKTDLKNTMAAVGNLEKNQEKLEKSQPGDSHYSFFGSSIDTKEMILNKITREISRLQVKYNASWFGSCILSPVSRGYSHQNRMRALTALQQEIQKIPDHIKKDEIHQYLSPRAKKDFKDAYDFNWFPEEEDISFREEFLGGNLWKPAA